MNRAERIIYDFVAKNPRVKNIIVDVYQRMFSYVPIRKHKETFDISVREGTFYGFHDKCPWSIDNRMLLAHKFDPSIFRMPKKNEEIEIGYFEGEKFNHWRTVGKTKSWNWQQGSMLQWMGKSLNILFNDYDGKNNVAHVVDLKGEHVKTIPKAVAAVNCDGTMALSYSFERMKYGAPPYAYANGYEPEENNPIPKHDGLYLIDINKNDIHRLFSIEDIVLIEPNSSMDNAYHYISHCQFSASGKKFTFYHRWLLESGYLKSRLFSYDLETRKIFLFPTSGMVSHMAWKDDQFILAYASTEKYGDKYYLFEDQTDGFSVIGEKDLKSDGHPQFSVDKRFILTDTYPDRFRRQFLIIYDTEEKVRKDIAMLRIPFQYRYALRCDFHPRWNRDSSMVCFDSAHTGIRSLCTMKI